MSAHPLHLGAVPSSGAPVRVLLLWCPAWAVAAARTAHAISSDAELALIDKGVVVDCSDAARREGVTPGIRLRQAQHRCPDMIVLAHDPDLDRRVFEPVLRAVEQVVPGVHLVRPGVAAVRAQGPSRFYGGDRAAAETLMSHLRSRLDHDVRLAVADGLFVAEQAARSTTPESPVALVPAGGSREFVAHLPVSTATTDLGSPRMGNMLKRLGIRTLGDLAGLPESDVHARFGAAGRQAHLLASGHDLPALSPREIPTDLSARVTFDSGAHEAELIVTSCASAVDELLRQIEQEAAVCTAVRVTIHTTTTPADRVWRHPWHFTADDVLDRVRWQLRDLGTASGDQQLAEQGGREQSVTAVDLALETVVPAQHQAEGLWGARPDQHVIHAITTLQHRLGHDGVLGGSLGGGRLLHERRLLRPWGEPGPSARERRDDQPWPGAVPGPAPASVFETTWAVGLLDTDRQPITVTSRGDLSAEPMWFLTRPGRADVPGGLRVVAWAGPWPLRQRWWRGAPAYDRVQLVDERQQAWLLLHESGQWWAEARYD